MIVIDTSALVAMYRAEPDALLVFRSVRSAGMRFLPPSCIVEFRMLRRYAGDRKAWLDTFMRGQNVTVPAFVREMAEIAADAADRYGRGSGHPAGLNFGDCLSYAVAKHLEAPLLYKGGDFIHTDIESALAS